jgi:hypothetical protein
LIAGDLENENNKKYREQLPQSWNI